MKTGEPGRVWGPGSLDTVVQGDLCWSVTVLSYKYRSGHVASIPVALQIQFDANYFPAAHFGIK